MRLGNSEQEFLLVCEAIVASPEQIGGWRFVLESIDGQPILEASDQELGDNNRLALWSVVRGLEAIPEPAAVTMLTTSRYITRSMVESLPRWRERDYHWDHYGQRLPVTNADLWRRVDRLLAIHAVSACCVAPAQQVSRRLTFGPTERKGPNDARASLHGPCQRITDGLRRWLVSQCRTVTGDFSAADPASLAIA
jgi:ribonuclease HI